MTHTALLARFNQTAVEFPADKGLKELFEEQVAKTPDAIAVECGSEQLTYRELNDRANGWARLLIRAGVGPETVVPLLAPRGIPLLTAMLAVFKSGAAYLPLDPAHPPDRIKQVLEQLPSRLAMAATAQKRLLDGAVALLGRSVETLELDKLPLDAAPNPPTRARPSSLAYVIFTSGSTGAPKGAMVEQLGMVNHLFAKVRDLGLSARDVVAETASQCFDISVWQFFSALVVGGRTVIFPDAVTTDPKALVAEIQQRKLTIVELVPSMLGAVLEVSGRGVENLRYMVATGEALPPELCRRWFARYPIGLVNAYGPTECSDDVTHHFLKEAPAAAITPIGKPIGNVKLYVLDDALNEVAPGTPGELYVGGGICIGRGYVGRPDLTAERFIPDHFEGGGKRLYRTGDLVRLLESGALEFLGRVDFQVKVRGYRIELGEIEAKLLAQPGVRDAVVAAREDGGDKMLVGYIVANPGAKLECAALQAELAKTLPEYMVPPAFVFMDALPLTSNGKVDRKALPAPKLAPKGEKAFEEPQGNVEKKVAQLWLKIRKLDKVGRNDDFFEAGGNSLTLMQLATRVSDLFDIELPAGLLFDAPTVSGVAALVEAALAKKAGASAAPQKAVSAFKMTPTDGSRALREVPVSYTEERHFRLWQEALDHIAGRLVSGTFWLEGELNVEAFRKAIAQLLKRHDLLRSIYALSGDSVVRRIQPQPELPFRVVDFSSAPNPEEAALAEVDEELLRRFDLLRELPFRAGLFKLSPERHLAYVRADHIIADNEGFRLLINELKALYNAFARGEQVNDDGPASQYADFALWQRRLCADDEFRNQELEYWREKIAGARPITHQLPTDLPRGPVDALRAERYLAGCGVAQVNFVAPPQTANLIKAVAQKQSANLSAAVLAAFTGALARRAKVDELFVSTLNDFRRRVSGLDGMLGSFNNSTLLHMKVDGATHAELIRRAQGELNSSFARPEFPLIPLVFPRLNDFFRVTLTFVPETEEEAPLPWHGLKAKPLSRQAVLGPKFKSIWDLMLLVFEEQGTIRGVMSYNSQLWNEQTARGIADDYVQLLTGMAQRPDERA